MAGSSLIGSVPKGTVKGITEKLNILGYKKIIVASFLIKSIHSFDSRNVLLAT